MATRFSETLNLAGARIISDAAEARAREIGVPMCICVVDAHTHVLSYVRMDGAKISSRSIAEGKAYTAAGHRVGTHLYKENVWPGGPAFGINNSNDGKFTTIAGGLPIKSAAGEVIGAVGCSTGTPTQDQICAQAGVDAIVKALKLDGAVEKGGVGFKAKL